MAAQSVNIVTRVVAVPAGTVVRADVGDDSLGVSRDDVHVLGTGRTARRREHHVCEDEVVGIGPVGRQIPSPVLGESKITASWDQIESIHVAAVYSNEPAQEAVADVMREAIGRPLQANLGAARRYARGGTVGPRVAPEHVVERAVLLDDDHYLLDGNLRAYCGRLGGGSVGA